MFSFGKRLDGFIIKLITAAFNQMLGTIFNSGLIHIWCLSEFVGQQGVCVCVCVCVCGFMVTPDVCF